MTKLTRHNIDSLLDSGRLEVGMRNGRWWKLRRNGATKTWKTDPERIRVPVKAGMYTYDVIATYRNDLGPRGGHLLDSPYIRIIY
jgi:hypothetical protein